ncbi:MULTISPECIES: NADH-quinone oxidoreductase subunit M [unclassified Leptolyngbya]|uniref:NADH-quinone oxidoreductase subunit M n=1 Tax=unclassified Leptolyngbya TaxID=2650499 RepID=UPI0016833412|nr:MULTISPECIES: NADH-quinone oxidoreductase subunit M [unclassified Leptolyngbya]MBD1910245.1 NADH-quinone oxidoreductase subunit M [Leptolyngbya sp. FACHB-8]MBD2156432.1 NADH-quinone oxidoreductase subunit M [Leptolyngbya sp. FACHB-16]
MLSLLIWIPIIGAGVVAFAPGNVSGLQARWGAAAVTAFTLVLSLVVMFQFNLGDTGMQFVENIPWIEQLGLNYQLGVDGLSLLMLVLNSLLTLIAILSTKTDIERPRLYYSMLLLIVGGVAGAFAAQNLLLFFLFYELELIPFYLLVSIWGGSKRSYAATKFLIYTAISGALILLGFLGLIWFTHSTSFAFESLLGQTLPLGMQILLLSVLLVGFGIKIPLVPFHTWLPDTYVEASAPVAILLGGVLAKLGAYGIFRFGLGLFPEAWNTLSPWLAIWAAVSIMYGALAAIAQKDIKRMVAYSSIGHMGYILLGGAALTALSVVGAVSQMVAHGLILAVLFNLVGVIEAKVGTRELDVLNGLMNPIRGLPATASLLVVGAMASAGIPGLVGFISEFLIFQGSYARFPLQTLFAVAGTGLTAVYFVILLNRTCFGKLDNKTAYYPKVTTAEKVPALVLTILILFLGIQPTWLVRWLEPTSTAMVAAVPTVELQQIAINPEVAPN